jgi:hypothetical protein
MGQRSPSNIRILHVSSPRPADAGVATAALVAEPKAAAQTNHPAIGAPQATRGPLFHVGQIPFLVPRADHRVALFLFDASDSADAKPRKKEGKKTRNKIPRVPICPSSEARGSCCRQQKRKRKKKYQSPSSSSSLLVAEGR